MRITGEECKLKNSLNKANKKEELKMDRELRRFAVSIFLGGLIGGFTCFVFFPGLLIMGLISGCAGGYVAYLHRQIMRKIPEAYAYAVERVGLGKIERGARATPIFIRRYYLYFIVHLINVSLVMFLILVLGTFMTKLTFIGTVESMVNAGGMTLLALIFMSNLFAAGVLGLTMEYVLMRKKKFFLYYGQGLEDYKNSYVLRYGYTGIRFNFSNLLKYFVAYGLLYGLWIIIQAICIIYAYAMMYLCKAVLFFLCFFGRLFVRVHKKEAALCGIFSALGVFIGFVKFYKPELGAYEGITGSIFCGIIGSALGVAYHQTIGLKIRQMLHIVPVRNGV